MEVNGVGSGRMSELLVKMLVFRKCHFRSDPISHKKWKSLSGKSKKGKRHRSQQWKCAKEKLERNHPSMLQLECDPKAWRLHSTISNAFSIASSTASNSSSFVGVWRIFMISHVEISLLKQSRLKVVHFVFVTWFLYLWPKHEVDLKVVGFLDLTGWVKHVLHDRP